MSQTPNAPPALAQATFPEDLLRVLRRLEIEGHAAYVVGGSLRDLLLGRPVKDYDVATSCRAENVRKLFKKVIPTGIEHGTVTVISGALSVEVTTFRGEGAYLDGRRPESVVFLDDVVEDLARRDFTINAMAFDPVSGSFVDPFGGVEDLGARRLRCVGDPRQRFSEDGLRPLRAVRFASVLDFQIDPPTFAAIPETLETFSKVAVERIREELDRLLASHHPDRGVRLLLESGLLPRILPEVAALAARGDCLERTVRRLARAPAALEVRLAALLRDLDCGSGPPSPQAASAMAAEAVERLKHPRKVVETVAHLVLEREFGLQGPGSDADLRRAASRVGRKAIPALLDLAQAEASAGGDPESARRASEFRTALERVLASHPPLTLGELALGGQRVMEILGTGPGPAVGVAMRRLLDRVLEDPSLNRADALEGLLRSVSRA